jgi:hypothetical protein
MMGGSGDNKNIFTFGPEGWADLGTTLTDGIYNPKSTQCSIVTGDDGSKVLEEYQLGVTPNTITRFVLWAGGKPAPPGTTVGGAHKSRKRKRELTANNWPAYNGTLAPSLTRSGFAIAEAPNGLAIISGGNANEPLAVFNQKENTWVDVNSIFGSNAQVPLSAPSSTGTHGPLPTTTPPPAPAVASGKSSMLTVLGATLGAVLGLAALLVLALLLLRWGAEKTGMGKGKKTEETEKENRMSFADQGAEYMQEAGGSLGRRYSGSLHGSMSSLQIINGRGGNGHRRGASDASTLGLVKGKSPLGITEPMEMEDKSPPGTAATGQRPTSAASIVGDQGQSANQDRSGQSRSTGWSQYFANNNVTDLAAMPDGRHYSHEGQSMRSSDLSRSEYDGDQRHQSNMRPLELNLGPRFDGDRISDSSGNTTFATRAISLSSFGDAPPPLRNYFSENNRESQASFMTDATNMTQFPRGVPSPTAPLFGNAFAKPPTNSGAPRSNQTYDFPMPRAYFGEQHRDSGASNMTQFPPTQSVGIRSPVITPGPSLPKPSSQRGPVIRKMTGDEDMSWLNINAPPGGRPM